MQVARGLSTRPGSTWKDNFFPPASDTGPGTDYKDYMREIRLIFLHQMLHFRDAWWKNWFCFISDSFVKLIIFKFKYIFYFRFKFFFKYKFIFKYV